MTIAAAPQRLVMGHSQAASLGALRWLSPVLIGLCAPMVAGLMIFPGLIEHGRFVIGVVLAALTAIAAIAYTMTVLNPGPVTGLVIDRASRSVTISRDGMFATSTRIIAMDEVADLRMSQSYDDDGYAIDVAQLHIRSGEVLTLQLDISANDIAAARRTMGLATARR